MYQLYDAIKNRIDSLLTSEAFLREDALSGTNVLKIVDSKDFIWENFNIFCPEIIIQDITSTGNLISGGYEGMPVYEIESIDNGTNSIILKTNLSKDWTVANLAKVKKAPSGIQIKDIRLGDLEVVTNFPTVCIVPTSKNIEWITLSGSMDTLSVDFIVYHTGEDTDRATREVIQITDALEYILMTNLHIQPTNLHKDWEKSSKTKISRVEYGVVQKGSQFLKASKISWDVDMYMWRGYITQQGLVDAPAGK